MSEAFSKTFDCEASPECEAAAAALRERLNTILSEIHSKLAEGSAVRVTVSHATVELPTPAEYERLKNENENLKNTLIAIRDNPSLWRRGGAGGQDQYAGLPTAVRYITDALGGVFEIGASQQSYIKANKMLGAELKAVREMRDRLLSRIKTSYDTVNFYFEEKSKSEEMLLTIAEAEAQQAAEKKGGE